MKKELIPDFNKKFQPTKKQLTTLNNLRKSEKIPNFLILKTKKDKDTRRNYAGYIRDYFLTNNITNPDKYIQDPRRMTNGKKIDYLDKIENDVEKFNQSLETKSGSYRKANLSAIRKLLEKYKIELGNSFWEDIRKNGDNSTRETEIETPTKEQLINILNHADEEAKAIFLMKMTSGSRLKELIFLTFENLHKDTEPPSFRVPKELSKTGKATTKFFTPEAKKWLEIYLKKRKEILETRLKRTPTINNKEKLRKKYENRVFPMGKTLPETIWNNLLKKEGLYEIDEKTRHPKMGTHSLRRYFEDNIGNRKLAKYMLNKLSKSEEPYQYKTKHKLEEEYLQNMHNLYVFEETEENKEKLKKLTDEIEKVKKENEKAVREKDRLQEQTQNLERQVKKLSEHIYKSTKQHTEPEDDIDYLTYVKFELDEDSRPIFYVIDKQKGIIKADPIRNQKLSEYNNILIINAIKLKQQKKHSRAKEHS